MVLEELNLFGNAELSKPKVLFINFGENEAFYSLKAISKLREKGIKSELYPDSSKLKKQMNYANKREIPFTVLVGEQELSDNNYTLKNMNTGDQISCNLEELIRLISK